MTIKHSMYTQKYPFYGQKGPVWFFSGFGIRPKEKLRGASFTDQREYQSVLKLIAVSELRKANKIYRNMQSICCSSN